MVSTRTMRILALYLRASLCSLAFTICSPFVPVLFTLRSRPRTPSVRVVFPPAGALALAVVKGTFTHAVYLPQTHQYTDESTPTGRTWILAGFVRA